MTVSLYFPSVWSQESGPWFMIPAFMIPRYSFACSACRKSQGMETLKFSTRVKIVKS